MKLFQVSNLITTTTRGNSLNTLNSKLLAKQICERFKAYNSLHADYQEESMGNDNGNKSAIKEHNPAFFWLPTLQTPPICMRNIQGRHRHRPRLTFWLKTRNTRSGKFAKKNLIFKELFSVLKISRAKRKHLENFERRKKWKEFLLL